MLLFVLNTVNFEDVVQDGDAQKLRFMIAGCSLCFLFDVDQRTSSHWNFLSARTKAPLHPLYPEEACLLRASGDVRGVARRRCSDHWYSGDWDQVEGYPFSSWLSCSQ